MNVYGVQCDGSAQGWRYIFTLDRRPPEFLKTTLMYHHLAAKTMLCFENEKAWTSWALSCLKDDWLQGYSNIRLSNTQEISIEPLVHWIHQLKRMTNNFDLDQQFFSRAEHLVAMETLSLLQQLERHNA